MHQTVFKCSIARFHRIQQVPEIRRFNTAMYLFSKLGNEGHKRNWPACKCPRQKTSPVPSKLDHVLLRMHIPAAD